VTPEELCQTKQVSKVNWKRPHCHLVTPHGCEWTRLILTTI